MDYSIHDAIEAGFNKIIIIIRKDIETDFRERIGNRVEKVDDTAFCMAGCLLKNTLSENGGVTRGVCNVDEKHMLTEIVETSNIVKCGDHAEADGHNISLEAYVSMNMWGLSKHFVDMLEEGFKEFFKQTVPMNPLKAEFLLPVYIGKLLDDKKISVKVLETKDKWFGVTYMEDKPFVVESFQKLIEEGVYKEELYSDL